MPSHSSTIINFPAILASSIHDIKNSLSHIRGLIKHLAKRNNNAEDSEFQQLEIEANRMNSSLMQLLILYKIDSSLFKPVIDEFPVIDILADVAAQQESLLALNNIELMLECPEDLMCYCDNALINTALISIINNAQRYCRKKILLSAHQTAQGGVCFCVEDDGKGYPENLKYSQQAQSIESDFSTGNTGLGLFFAVTIAQLHTQGSQKGYITTDNDSRLGGARFNLLLP
ncbi:MAG: sensor histidine kinase [Gammaproteobacteria bacterium]